ncbi:hypothetical protein CRM22_008244 [Opisthorchis felineus]|uniref:Ig-like domain-containing protein n=1 Tax=Opisthorchis felineus TaxID=147828 RepID=A0A4S2LE21_OPIFE|nr:hypothetical protein CRM22_008244 [Opisthorchis felineus]
MMIPYFLLFSLLVCPGLGSTHFSLTVIPANQPVLLGQKVILTCQVKGFKRPLDYAVLFKRKDVGISEKCQTYQKNKYHLECEPNNWLQATTYKLYINSVSWADRGDWFCVYAANLTRQHLVVHAPAELKKMAVTSLPFNPLKSENDRITPVDGSPVLAKLSKSSSSSAVSGAPGQPPAQHVGLGTRTNPYDLRPGLGLQLTCETTCGYPEANISWLLLNETASRVGTTIAGPNRIRSETCDLSPSTQDMTTTTSTLNVNCVELGLIGLNEVQCAVTGRQYIDHTPTRHVYVLCPDQFELDGQRALLSGQEKKGRQRGERPLQLTNGEVVGIAVGAAIALILLFLGCIILRASRKDSPLPFNPNYFPGQRV